MSNEMNDNAKTSLGLDENVEALLAYVLGWLSGIILLVLEKNSKSVRFHAMQSTITFIMFTVLSIILTIFTFFPFIGFLFGLANGIIMLIALITWIICLIKAYRGEMFKLPIIGTLAEKYTK